MCIRDSACSSRSSRDNERSRSYKRFKFLSRPSVNQSERGNRRVSYMRLREMTNSRRMYRSTSLRLYNSSTRYLHIYMGWWIMVRQCQWSYLASVSSAVSPSSNVSGAITYIKSLFSFFILLPSSSSSSSSSSASTISLEPHTLEPHVPLAPLEPHEIVFFFVVLFMQRRFHTRSNFDHSFHKREKKRKLYDLIRDY